MDANDRITVEKDCASFAKNATCEVRGRFLNVRGRACADVRTFAAGAGGDMVPTRAGVCIGREKLPELLALVERMIEDAGLESGTFPDGDGGGVAATL